MTGIWPWFGGGCHPARDTRAAIERAGFTIDQLPDTRHRRLLGRRLRPCKALAPLLDDLAHDTAGLLRVGTVRLDDNPALTSRYEIMALPTVIVFTDGLPAKRLTANRDNIHLYELISEFLPA